MSINKISWTNKAGKQTRWRVELPADTEGKRATKTFQTKAEAKTWETEQLYLREKQTGRDVDEELLFEELVSLWMDHHVSRRSEATKQRYSEIMRHHVLPIMGDLVACEVGPMDVARWFRSLSKEEKGSIKSKNMALTLLKGVFTWAVKSHYLLYNPATATESIPTDEEVDFAYWSEPEVEYFLRATAMDHYHPLYLTALNTGMRLGELVGLQRDRVDLRRRIIRVSRTWCNKSQRLKNTTKGKKARSVPINELVSTALAESMMRNPADCPWVFTDKEGRRIRSHTFTEQVFRPTCRKVECREIRFHDLRHTYASQFVMNGGDLYRLQKILGHHSITITEMYAHLAPDYMQEAADIVSFGGRTESGGVVAINSKPGKGDM